MLQLSGTMSSAPIRRICATVLLGLSLTSTSMYGQSTYGAIIGTVKDTSGAVVGNVSIKVTNTDENESHEVKSNNNGNYELLNILPGHYTVTASAAGFETFTATDLLLVSRQTLRVDPE